MDKYKIQITRQARDHLREIRRYIEAELFSPLAARNTLEAIRNEMQALSQMPGRVRLVPEQPWHDQGIRRARVKNYYIYFWIDGENKTVQIIAVIYVHREQSKQLDDMKIKPK